MRREIEARENLHQPRANAGSLAWLNRLARFRGLANSSGLFVISLIKIRMKLYGRPRVGWAKAGETYSFRADIAGLETAAKTAKFEGRAYQHTSTIKAV